ncbi:MAG: ribonuclease D [Planctomycetota bacterium]|jgi:ribonuclease D
MNKTEIEENFQYQYIDSPALLEDLLSHLHPQHTVALDTEADSFHHYRPKVCLIQLSFDNKTYIVDPLAPVDIPALLTALANKELIIHDAGYDLRMLGGDYGFKPKNGVFDTMLAAALTGMKNVGLSALLEHVLDLKVAKHNQKADWSKRPLPKHLLRYAAEDTVSLMHIKSYLADRLTELGRTDWHTESCVAAVEAAQTSKEAANPDNEWRIKGTGTLSFKEMAFLRKVWYWRENIAKETNIAPFMICRNEEMIKLAQWAARRKKPIEDESKFPIRHKSNKSKALLKALQEAQALPPDQWPGPRKSDPSKRLSNTIRNTVNALKAECETIAAEHDLPLNLIASRAALTRIVLDNATTLEKIRKKSILLNWQANLILPAIVKVLSGHS